MEKVKYVTNDLPEKITDCATTFSKDAYSFYYIKFKRQGLQHIITEIIYHKISIETLCVYDEYVETDKHTVEMLNELTGMIFREEIIDE